MNATTMEGVTVREDPGWGRRFIGTREALLAAGVVDGTKFPGDPGNRKAVVRYQDGDRRIVVYRRRSNRFEVWRSCSEEEAAAQRSANDAARELAKLPDSERAFQEGAKARAEAFAVALHAIVSKGSGGYRFHPASVREVIAASVALVNVVAEARVVLDRAGREREVAAIKARASRGDPTFQRFMRAVTEDG